MTRIAESSVPQPSGSPTGFCSFRRTVSLTCFSSSPIPVFLSFVNRVLEGEATVPMTEICVPRAHFQRSRHEGQDS
jgi:hypothetical protein